MSLTALPCTFCAHPLPHPSRTIAQCPMCGAYFLRAANTKAGFAALSAAIEAANPQHGRIETTTITLGDDSNDLLCIGWDVDENLTAAQVATVLGRSKNAILSALQNGRFNDAKHGAIPGMRGGWLVPRWSIQEYRRTGRKAYTMSTKARKARVTIAKTRKQRKSRKTT